LATHPGWGNTDLWVAAGLAAGLRWGWPAALLFLKPTFGILALTVIRDRRLWIGMAVLAVASLPVLGLWIDYLEAMQNLRIGWDYSVPGLPLVALPVVAALAGRSDQLPITAPLPARREVGVIHVVTTHLRTGPPVRERAAG
jgi:hypothetical protein